MKAASDPGTSRPAQADLSDRLHRRFYACRPVRRIRLGETVAFLPLYKQALIRRGIPELLYGDKGGNYRSRQLVHSDMEEVQIR